MPYAPGVSYNPGAIYQGLAGGAADIASAMVAKKEKEDQDKDFAARTRSTESFIKSHASDLGWNSDQVKELLATNLDETPRARYLKLTDGLSMAITGSTIKKQNEESARKKEIEGIQLATLKQGMVDDATNRRALQNAFNPEMAGMAQALSRPGYKFGDAAPAVDDPLAAYTGAGGTDGQTIASLAPLARQLIKKNAPQPGSAGFSTVDIPGAGKLIKDNATGEVLDSGKINKPTAAANPEPEYTKDGAFYRSNPSDDWKPVPGASRSKDAADVTFDSNLDVAFQKLDEYKKIVEKFGNFESQAVGNPQAAAALEQLPYNLAILHAKIVDPSSVAREGEVAAAQKYILPAGLFKTNATTLAALENERNTLEQYRKARGTAKGAGRKVADSVDATPEGRDSVANLYTDTDGTKYRIQTIKGHRGVMKGGKFYPIIQE